MIKLNGEAAGVANRLGAGKTVRKAGTDLLSNECSASCIVQVQKGLKILKVVGCSHLIQGLAWERVQDIVPLSQLEHELGLKGTLNVKV